MAITSTSKPDAQDTAAYAASQPLFDSIRDAISQLDQQRRNLASARDIVQQLHVKVPAEHLDGNGLKDGDYTNSLAEAWKTATESFTRIFEQLCSITGSDPATGKEAETSYAGFQALLKSAEAAKRVATGHVSQDVGKRGKRKSETEEQDEGSMEITPRKKARSTPPESPKLAAASVPASSKRAVPGPGDGQEAPRKRQRTAVEQKQEPEAAINGNSSTKRQRRRQSVREKQKHPNQPSAKENAPITDGAQEARVQYEDVSAEVDARLKAKEDAKKAKKEAKKRKRDSLGSGIVEAEAGAENEALAARDRKLKEKPAKKRSKSESGEPVRVDAVTEASEKAKGKRHGETGEAEGRKKRKKAK